MKTKLTLILLLAFSMGYCQKSSPVIGDAAILIDLLKKDYNLVNPDNRDEELAVDRAKVIATFKSYLDDKQKNAYKTTTGSAAFNTIKNDLKTSYESYAQVKETKISISKVNINISDKNPLSDALDTIAEVDVALVAAKSDYYEKKYKYDAEEFKALETSYANNAYIKAMIGLFKTKYSNLQNDNLDIYAEKNAFASIQKSIPLLGGDMEFKTIIDGLSRFLAKRIKEELTIYAIDKIKTYLKNPTPENYCYELKVILPTTTDYLLSFEADQLLNFPDEIKQYIEQDLNNLLKNAVRLKDTPRLKSYIEKNPDLEFAFEGLEIIPQLSKIKSPIDYFEILENSRTLSRWREDPTQKTKYNIAQSMRLASMIAYSMTVADNGEIKFASVDLISNYANEINFYFLYFGFLHQQNTKYFNVNFVPASSTTPTSFDLSAMMNTGALSYSSVTNNTKNLILLKSNLSAIASNAEKIYTQALALKKKNKNNEEIKFEEVYSFIDDFISFTQEISITADLLLDKDYSIFTTSIRDDVDLQKNLAPYFNIAHISNDLMLDLHQKKYSNAILKAIEIPLNLRSNSSNISNNLLDLSNQVKLNSDLNALRIIFNKDEFSKLKEKEQIEQLQNLSPKLDVLIVKMEGNTNLSTVQTELNTLNAYLKTVNSKNLKDLETKSTNLKTALKTEIDNDHLMEFAGISKAKLLEELQKQLEKNGYSTAIQTKVKGLVDTYIKDKYKELIINEAPVSNQNTMTAVITEFAPQLLESNVKMNDNKALKIIHFVNEMASAKDAEGVEKAIEAFALPVGSSSLKEKAESYIALNSFPGLLFGIEKTDTKSGAFFAGFTAPVGLYLQPWSGGKKGDTFGIFIPVIDIGAPVRLRLDGTKDTQTLPDLKFNDIFSPGFYLIYGFRNSPFALNLGAQYGPKLRTIDENNEPKTYDSFRIGFGITIDIPLLTLSRK